MQQRHHASLEVEGGGGGGGAGRNHHLFCGLVDPVRV